MKCYLDYRLIKTKRRLTFEILFQDMRFCGKSDDDYLTFTASNGISIISRSRMDVQTDRLWLLGCGPDERSGSMVFSSDEKRDKMFDLFQDALREWAKKCEQFDNDYKSDVFLLEQRNEYTFVIGRYEKGEY
jgi:hypothetical protein